MLKAVAQVCLNSLRPGDVLGRLGGEEFAILLPATEFFTAARCAERIRKEVAGLTLSCGTVTTSLGLAAAAEHQSFDEWLAAADAALYRAKHNGRNRWMAEHQTLRAA